VSQSSSFAWAGEQLNNERLQGFAFGGGGVPAHEFPCGSESPVVTAAAMNADLAAVIDQPTQNGPLQIRAYRSTSTTPLWTYDVSELYKGTGYRNLRISRDGSTVVAAVIDTTTYIESLITLNGSDGSFRSQWTGAIVPPATQGGGCSGVEVTDDGSKAIICEGSPPAGIGRLINTTNGTQITTFSGNGAGGWFNISGNGDVIVIGGFSLRVYVWNGTSYVLRINFNASDRGSRGARRYRATARRLGPSRTTTFPATSTPMSASGMLPRPSCSARSAPWARVPSRIRRSAACSQITARASRWHHGARQDKCIPKFAFSTAPSTCSTPSTHQARHSAWT
jgi:hypothetical protein